MYSTFKKVREFTCHYAGFIPKPVQNSHVASAIGCLKREGSKKGVQKKIVAYSEWFYTNLLYKEEKL